MFVARNIPWADSRGNTRWHVEQWRHECKPGCFRQKSASATSCRHRRHPIGEIGWVCVDQGNSSYPTNRIKATTPNMRTRIAIIFTRLANLILSRRSFFSIQACHRPSSSCGTSVGGGLGLATVCVSRITCLVIVLHSQRGYDRIDAAASQVQYVSSPVERLFKSAQTI